MKVLLVSESFSKNDSGGKVARYLYEILINLDVNVNVVVLSDAKNVNLSTNSDNMNVSYLHVKRNFYLRLFNIFFQNSETKSFKKILNEFNPDIVHFASFENSKPSRLILEVKKFGSKLILQPWTMHFFCAQGFAFRNNKVCTKCINGNYLNAIKYHCVGLKSIPSLFERYFIHKRALMANVFFSSNSSLDTLLQEYNVPQKNIFRFPIPFDFRKHTPVNEDLNLKLIESGYFIYYGQVNEHKGFNVLIEVFKRNPSLKLKVFPMNYIDESQYYNSNIEIHNNVNWNNGLREHIINSKAVLIPSLWITSTEYSLCEALFLKKAVVLFNVGVHKDLFFHKVNAMVVENEDIESYEKVIIELNDDTEMRKNIAIKGYETLINYNDMLLLGKDLLRGYGI